MSETNPMDAIASLRATIHALDAAGAALERERSQVAQRLRELAAGDAAPKYVRAAGPEAPRMNGPVPPLELELAEVKRLLHESGAGALVRLAQRRGLASKLVRETVRAALDGGAG